MAEGQQLKTCRILTEALKSEWGVDGRLLLLQFCLVAARAPRGFRKARRRRKLPPMLQLESRVSLAWVQGLKQKTGLQVSGLGTRVCISSGYKLKAEVKG